MKLFEITTESDVARSFAVMRELRPHFTNCDGFVQQVMRQMKSGYRLVAAERDGQIVALGGFRTFERLSWGRMMYVDDLVTAAASLGTGAGSALMDWMVAVARAEGCDEFHLDSGVQRYGAHRFYLHKGMDITCHHFAMKLPPVP